MLLIEALLIIIQLAVKHEPWISMMSFWSIVAMDNLLDIIGERNGKNGSNGGM